MVLIQVIPLFLLGLATHRATSLNSGNTETHRDIAQRHTRNPNCEIFSKSVAVAVLRVSLCHVSVCLCATALPKARRRQEHILHSTAETTFGRARRLTTRKDIG